MTGLTFKRVETGLYHAVEDGVVIASITNYGRDGWRTVEITGDEAADENSATWTHTLSEVKRTLAKWHDQRNQEVDEMTSTQTAAVDREGVIQSAMRRTGQSYDVCAARYDANQADYAERECKLAAYDALAADNARLREALADIAARNMTIQGAKSIARKALEVA